MDRDVELVVGTYEDYVVGYRHSHSSLDQTFAVRCHSGSVKALACSQNGCLILSVGYDDMMNVFNMKKRKLICTLEGSVNCVKFIGNAHVICGSEDGSIYIYECKQDVVLRKTLRGHKGPVVALDAHPSSKLLLTLSKDRTMRTWNLVKARCAYVTRIKSDAHLVKWSKTGNQFIIASQNEIYLYNNMGAEEKSIKLDKRVNHVEFVSESSLVVATDSGKLDFFDLKLNHQFKLDAHNSRIKSVVCLRDSLSEGIRLATASSDGKVRLWSYAEADQLKLLADTDTGARITCMNASVVKSSIVETCQ